MVGRHDWFGIVLLVAWRHGWAAHYSASGEASCASARRSKSMDRRHGHNRRKTTMIRVARVEDAEGILAIYGPVVDMTVVSFEVDPPSLATIQQRITAILQTHPWLVYEHQERICGYAYASRHRDRAAYQWSADVTVYVHPECRRQGVGHALYTSLLALLRLQGFFNAYAGITLPNPASVGLHEAVGFRQLGVYGGVGYKLGAWHDVGWWHLALRPKAPDPEPPLAFPHAGRIEGFPAALEAGSTMKRERATEQKGASMAVDRSFIERNAHAQSRLAALVATLNDEQLQLPLDDGWTVAAALAHLAFWDRRVLALLEHWDRQGVAPSPYDADVFNAALLPISLALPPRRAAELAVTNAAAVDAKIATLSDEMLQAIYNLPAPPRLERALHRQEHLAAIELAVTG
jgi:phosphinothricin acetyltransferase